MVVFAPRCFYYFAESSLWAHRQKLSIGNNIITAEAQFNAREQRRKQAHET